MKVISNVFFISALFLTSCGMWGGSEPGMDDSPVLSSSVQAETGSRIDFSRHVKPILEARCVACHDGKDKKVAYALTSRKEAFKNKNIVPGKPKKSLLYVAAAGEHPAINEDGDKIKIAASDVKVIERWILSGAVWPEGASGHLEAR